MSAREAASAARDEQGQRLVSRRYRVEGLLGTGSMGSVRRAYDQVAGRPVALKLLMRADEASRASFRREYLTLSKLAHPRVIRVFEFGATEGGQPFYTMELLDGQDLFSSAPLSWLKACEVLRDVCTSLALLHAQRLVHRDVNPRNVRIDGTGRAKLLDFGALTAFGVQTDVVGAPSCVAPEQLRRQPLDGRADLFSLGVVAYWALTRRVPFAIERLDGAEQAWQSAPRAPSAYAPDVPSGLDELVLSLLSSEPSGRPSSAAEVIDRLGALASLEDEPLGSIAESHVTSATLIGRDPELTVMHEQLARAEAGRGSVLCVRGEPGTGKTRMLRELSLEAEVQGFVTVQLGAREHAGAREATSKLVRSLLAQASFEVQVPEALRTFARRSEVAVSESSEVGEDTRGGSDVVDAQQRMERHVGLVQLIERIAERQPLLIAVDDADRLDASLASLLQLVAHATVRRRLLLMVAGSGGRSAAVVEQLAALASTVHLRALDEESVARLVQETFGDVPHRTRLAHWLMRASRGNPGQLRRALLGLVQRRVVRYAGGAWLLPADVSEQPLPDAATTLTSEDWARLPPASQTLLAFFALHPDVLSDQTCTHLLSNHEPARVRDTLQVLLAEGLLARTPEGMRLTQERAGSLLIEALQVEQRRAMHETFARVLTQEREERGVALDARMESLSTEEIIHTVQLGLHLLLAGDEERATPLLRTGAVELTVRGERLPAAVPALQQAVEHYRKLDRPPHEYGVMMTVLALAGTYSDWRLSYRYGPPMLELLAGAAGLPLAQRLTPFLGGTLSLYLALAFALLRWAFLPHRRFTRSFREVLLGLMGLGAAIVSVCTVLQDPERARAMSAKLEPLGFFPARHPVRFVRMLQLALVDHARGDYASARAKAHITLAYVRSERAARALPAPARLQLESGALILLGPLEACRTDDGAKLAMDALERLDVATSRQTLAATRASYHGHRGERAICVQWLEQMDRIAAEEGTTWRNDVQVPRTLWSTHMLCEDVLTLKRDVEQLQSLASQVSTVRRLRDVLHACYLSERGNAGEALARYESTLREALQESGLRAIQQLGAYARILRRAGRPAEALQICERALSRLTPSEHEFTILTFVLRRELPLALLDLGQHARARRLLDQLVADQAPHDNPVLHGLAHAARAELCLLERDLQAFDEHLAAMRSWIGSTQNAALLTQCQRLFERSRDQRPTTSLSPLARASNHSLQDDDTFITEQTSGV